MGFILGPRIYQVDPRIPGDGYTPQQKNETQISIDPGTDIGERLNSVIKAKEQARKEQNQAAEIMKKQYDKDTNTEIYPTESWEILKNETEKCLIQNL
ncbi:hypothetical protein AYI70_g7409 [Smittium culicis]|uniref:Uncharacterized protein n=1 Tax=Smittium culicis TaxID=133412 RepID=A0A1R1XKS7_9FUNG|nr:hypothetical protein AYI70_g7409 [Smittium culicis]